MHKYTKIQLESFIDNNHYLNLHHRELKDIDIPSIIIFLNSHPVIKTINLSCNQIGDAGAKALVSNPFIQHFRGNYSRSESLILAEKNPSRRHNYGREVGLSVEVPSLLRLSLFAVKEFMTQDNGSQDKIISADELGDVGDDLLRHINQHKI